MLRRLFSNHMFKQLRKRNERERKDEKPRLLHGFVCSSAQHSNEKPFPSKCSS